MVARKTKAADVVDSSKVKEDVQALAGAVQTTRTSLQSFVQTQVEERPLAVLGTAAGIGFVLGGGLAPRVLRTLLTLGTRLAINAVISEVIAVASGSGGREAEA
jgi:hypothetical protein